MHPVLENFLDALQDTVIVFCVLYLAFLLVGYFSHSKSSQKYTKFLHRTKGAGPLIGAFLGCIPQCGFSSVISQLYSNKMVTIGTLFAVFIATSDEAVLIMVVEPLLLPKLLLLIALKFVLAVILGYAIDLICKIFVKKGKKPAKISSNNVENQSENVENKIEIVEMEDIKSVDNIEADHVEVMHEHSVEEEVHKHQHKHHHAGEESCTKDIFLDALKHTAIMCVYIFIASFVIKLLLQYCGLEAIRSVFTDNIYLQILIACAVGLIPNCMASATLVTLYMENVIMFAPLVAGLCAGGGVGLLVLFMANRKHVWKNLGFTGMLFALSYLCGLVVSFIPNF